MRIGVQCCGRMAVTSSLATVVTSAPLAIKEAGIGAPQRVDIQCGWQVVLFRDQIEPPGKGGGRYGESVSIAAEDVVRIF